MAELCYGVIDGIKELSDVKSVISHIKITEWTILKIVEKHKSKVSKSGVIINTEIVYVLGHLRPENEEPKSNLLEVGKIGVDNDYHKSCNQCKKQIIMSKRTESWKAYDVNGDIHICKNNDVHVKEYEKTLKKYGDDI